MPEGVGATVSKVWISDTAWLTKDRRSCRQPQAHVPPVHGGKAAGARKRSERLRPQLEVPTAPGQQ